MPYRRSFRPVYQYMQMVPWTPDKILVNAELETALSV